MRLRRLVPCAVVLTALLAGCAKKGPVQAASSPAPPPPAKLTAKPVQLFYEDEGLLLAPVVENVALPDSDAAAIRPLLVALTAQPPQGTEPRPVPAGIEIRATYLLPDGTAIVDLGGPLFSTGWQTGAHAELMLAYSIVQTLTANLPSIRQVLLLVNGQPAETLGGHISLERALAPNPRFVRRQPAAGQ